MESPCITLGTACVSSGAGSWESFKSFVSTVADFLPVIGDAKAGAEAVQNPTPVNVIAAVVGLAPGAGDAAGKVLKGGSKVLRGARNPIVRNAAAQGRSAHKAWDPGAGYRKEVTLENGKRADAVSFQDRHVKELKPDNPAAVARGERQVEGYRQQLEKQTGQSWTCSVETYCRK